MRKIEGSSFFGTKAQDEGLRPKNRPSFAIPSSLKTETIGTVIIPLFMVFI